MAKFFKGDYFFNKIMLRCPAHICEHDTDQVWRWSLNSRACQLIYAESLRNGLVNIIMCIFFIYFVFITEYIYKLSHIQNLIQFWQKIAKIRPKVCYAEISLNKQVWYVELLLNSVVRFASVQFDALDCPKMFGL